MYSGTRIVRALVRRALSRRVLVRGSSRSDGLPTLLVVNYRGADDTGRLIASWRRFVSDQWPVIVVENSGMPVRRRFPGSTRVISLLVNLHHGLGLDLGLRFVSTEYTVICDPDSIIINESFWPTMRALVDDHGAASIDLGTGCYHPICLAFRTETWKHNVVSMEQDWSRGWDVGAALTDLLGGTHEQALLPRTRGAGYAIPTQNNGRHYIAEVYGDVFSNTFGASRIKVGDREFAPEEGSLDHFRDLHASWRRWADLCIDGGAALGDFERMVGTPRSSPTEE
jgi:hypothetical protein